MITTLQMFPRLAEYQRFKLSGPAGRVTAACGLGIYRDDWLGHDLAGNAVICEPVNLLLHRRRLEPRGVLFDAEEAADTVQEIFTLVYRHLHRFDRRARFSTWLFRIAVNRSIQQSRRLKVRPRQTELNEAVAEEPEPTSASFSDPRIEACLARLHPGQLLLQASKDFDAFLD